MNIRKRSWIWKGKPSRGYVLDGRIAGRRIRKQFQTRQEAELYRDQVIRERNSERYGAILDETITLEEFTKSYFEKKPWRTDTYRERADWSVKAMTPTFGKFCLTAITPALVEEYARTRLKDHAPSTIRQELATLSDSFRC